MMIYQKNIFYAVLMVALCVWCCAVPFSAQAKPSDDELLILEVNLHTKQGKLPLSDGMAAYYAQGRLYLPLQGIANLLQFPITVMVEEGQAEGWVVDPSKRFSVNLASREAIIAGDRETFAEGEVERYPDDLYVEANTLMRWLPLHIDLSVPQQRLTLSSTVTLPLEAALLREKQHSARRESNPAELYKDLPVQSVPYEIISPPTADVRMTSRYHKPLTGREGVTNDASVLMTQDLMFMDSTSFIRGSDEKGINYARLTLGRKSLDNDLLGPIKASQLSAGDVLTPQIPLIAQSQNTKGAVVSNYPVRGRVVDFDRITLQGDIASGWQVELYRNDTLLMFDQASDKGLYTFTDVPLVTGLNILRLVFYGPHGEKREEIQHYQVDGAQLDKGKTYYQFSAAEDNTDLIDVDPTPENAKTTGKSRFTGELEHKLSRNLSLTGNAVHVPLEDGASATYVSSGGRYSWDRFLTILGVSQELEQGGTALQSALRTNVGRTSLSFEHHQFMDFASEDTGSIMNPLLSRSTFRADGAVATLMDPVPPISLSLRSDLERFTDGQDHVEIEQRSSTFITPSEALPLSLTHFLRYDIRRGEGMLSDDERLQGEFLTSLRRGDFGIRGEVGYGIVPDAAMRHVALIGDYAIAPDADIRVGVAREMENGARTLYSAGISRKFDMLWWGINQRYDTDGIWIIETTLSFSLGQEPHEKKWLMTSSPLASQGTASLRTFLDEDNDGVFDAGDTPLEKVGFYKGRGKLKDSSNAQGIAVLQGVRGYDTTPIIVDTASLEDPYWDLQKRGVNLIARPGRMVPVSIPVIPTGEVDGVVMIEFWSLHGEWVSEPLANVELHLIGKDGKTVATARSAYDGFFLFQKVPYGLYAIEVDGPQMRRLQLLPTDKPALAELSKETPVTSGHQLVLRKLASSYGF